MNITESALVAAIVIAISGTVLYVGGKVFEQVESQTSYMEHMTTTGLDAAASMEQMAKAETERRQRLAFEHVATR